MATIEQRLQALENKVTNNLNGVVLIIYGDITQEQQLEIDEARKNGQKVILVTFVSPDPNRFNRLEEGDNG